MTMFVHSKRLMSSQFVPRIRQSFYVIVTVTLAISVFFIVRAYSAGTQSAQILVTISVEVLPSEPHGKAMFEFKRLLEESMPGEFDIRIFDQSTLYKQDAQMAALARNHIQASYLSPQQIAQRIPWVSVFTTGYQIKDAEHNCAVWNGEIGAEVSVATEEAINAKILGSVYLGMRTLHLREPREVLVPSDLAGVKLRQANTKTWQTLGRALGANPTPIQFSEIYMALQTGTIDAFSLPPASTISANLHEVTQQVVLTNHHASGVVFVVNMEFWGGLSDEQQRAFREAVQSAMKYGSKAAVQEELDAIRVMKERGIKFTMPDVSAFREHIGQFYAASELSQEWRAGMVDRILATTPDSACLLVNDRAQ